MRDLLLEASVPLIFAQYLVFALLLFGLAFGLHAYLWWRLTGSRPPLRTRTRSRWVFGGLVLVIPMTVGLSRAPDPIGSAAAWVGYVWMGWIFLAFAATLLLEPIRGLVRVAQRRSPEPDVGRRAWMGGALAAGTTIGTTALVAGGVREVLRTPRVRHVGIPIRGLDPAFHGYRIVQLTDLHVGPTIGRGFIEMVVGATNALSADAVAITGDLVDGSVARLGWDVAPLATLAPRDGVFFVTGNHEYYSGAAAWCAHLPTLGVRVLRNEHVLVRRGDATLAIAGVDDFKAARFTSGHGPDTARALEGLPEGHPTVLLAHQPIQVRDAAQRGVSAMLCGHTHGGQIQPFGLLVPLQQPYTRGLHAHHEPGGAAPTWLYVSCGTGYWGPPMRVGAPPEITLVELLAEDAAPFERAYVAGESPSASATVEG